MNPTLDHLVADARAQEVRWLERTASDRLRHRRFRRLPTVRSVARPDTRRPGA
jgi:hypothetical protein